MLTAALIPTDAEATNAALALLWLAIGLVLAILLWPRRRGQRLARQVWALAVLGFQEGLRLHILWTVLGLSLLCGVLAYCGDADGTHAGRARLVLDTCLTSGELLGAALVVSLSALSVSRELEARIMHTIGAKPVPRWTILAGKALGFWAIQLCFVAVLIGFTAALVRAVPARAETRAPTALVHTGTWDDLERNALTTRTYAAPVLQANSQADYAFIKAGGSKSWQFDVPAADGSARGQRTLRLVVSSTNTFVSHVDGVRTVVADESGKTLLDRTDTLPQGRVVEFPFDSPHPGTLGLSVTLSMTQIGGPKLIVSQKSGVRIGTRADAFATNLTKSAALLAIQGLLLALITTAWSGVLSFSVSVALGVILLLGGELSRQVVELLQGETQRLLQSGLEAGEREYQMQVVRQIERLLSMLPDFHAGGGPGFFVEGQYLPWLAIAHAALMMGLVRGLGWALPGFWSFQRREVGA
jgi:hypothetical protein